jgi:hypothetical protein
MMKAGNIRILKLITLYNTTIRSAGALTPYNMCYNNN